MPLTVETASRHPVAAAAPRAAVSTRRFALGDWWALLMLVVPIFGTFYPPETYFVVGDFSQQEFNDSKLMPVLLLSFAASIAIIYVALSRRMKVRHDILAYLFLLMVFVSITASESPMHSFLRALRLLPPIGFGILYAQAFDRKRLFELLTLAFLISAVCSIIMGLFFPAYGGSHLEGFYDSAWRGAMEHKNSAGAIYGIGILVAMHAFVSRAVPARLTIPVLLTCAFMLYKAQSATSITALAIAIPAYVVLIGLSRLPFNLRLFATVMTFFLIASLAIFITAFPEIVFGAIGRDTTFTGRTDIWDAVQAQIQRHPFRGHGYAFWSNESSAKDAIFQMVGYKPAHSHDDWLDLWLQLGIFGVIVVALEFAFSLAKGLLTILSRNSMELILPFSLMIYLLVRSLTEVQFCDPGTSGVFWMVWSAVLLRSGGRLPAVQTDLPVLRMSRRAPTAPIPA